MRIKCSNEVIDCCMERSAVTYTEEQSFTRTVRQQHPREQQTKQRDQDIFKNHIIKLGDYSRRENLCFYNIPENHGESNEECSRKVMAVLTECSAEPDKIQIQQILRTVL